MKHPRFVFGSIGGFFIGKKISTQFQQNRLFSIIISLTGNFQIFTKKTGWIKARSVLISPNIKFRIQTEESDSVIFVHIDPYSIAGLNIKRTERILILPDNCFQNRLSRLKNSDEMAMDSSQVDSLIEKMIKAIPEEYLSQRILDQRVLKCLNIINDEDSIDLHTLSSQVYLSLSRLSHLFKKETSITLQQYIQHRKMIKAIDGMHKNLSLTEAAYHGGFSDQPHFTHVFKKMFGIKPSKTRK